MKKEINDLRVFIESLPKETFVSEKRKQGLFMMLDSIEHEIEYRTINEELIEKNAELIEENAELTEKLENAENNAFLPTLTLEDYNKNRILLNLHKNMTLEELQLIEDVAKNNLKRRNALHNSGRIYIEY